MNAFGIFKCGKTVMDQINDELYFGESLCALLWILELESVSLCVLCIASDINYSVCWLCHPRLCAPPGAVDVVSGTVFI